MIGEPWSFRKIRPQAMPSRKPPNCSLTAWRTGSGASVNPGRRGGSCRWGCRPAVPWLPCTASKAAWAPALLRLGNRDLCGPFRSQTAAGPFALNPIRLPGIVPQQRPVLSWSVSPAQREGLNHPRRAPSYRRWTVARVVIVPSGAIRRIRGIHSLRLSPDVWMYSST